MRKVEADFAYFINRLSEIIFLEVVVKDYIVAYLRNLSRNACT